MTDVLPDVNVREDLCKIIDALDLKKGVELGVCSGDFSVYLLENSGLEKLYSVDAWSTDEDLTRSVFKRWAIRKGQLDEQEAETRRRLGEFGPRSEIVKGLTFDVVDKFPDAHCDFIYVDASHRFSGVALDLIKWWPKLKVGGIFAGHDYWKCYRYEVIRSR